MGKLKNHLIGLEDEFWAEVNNIIGSCETLPELCNTMWEYRELLPMHTDAQVMEDLELAWNDYWQEKGHE